MRRRGPRIAALLLITLGAGYIWGHYGVSRDWFPYPQIVDARRAITGETVDERPAYERGKPAGYSETVTMFERHGQPAELVIVGDSMLARAPWRDLLPGPDVANRAIAGDFAAWLPSRLDSVIATGADRAWVMIGLNDAVEGRSAEAIHADIVTVVRQLSDAGMAVTVLSPLPCTASSTHCGDTSATLLEVRKHLARDAGGAEFVDLMPVMAPQGHLLERYSLDGVHFNLSGFETLIAQLQ